MSILSRDEWSTIGQQITEIRNTVAEKNNAAMAVFYDNETPKFTPAEMLLESIYINLWCESVLRVAESVANWLGACDEEEKTTRQHSTFMLQVMEAMTPGYLDTLGANPVGGEGEDA